MTKRKLSITATLLLVAAAFGPACVGGQTGDGQPIGGDDNTPTDPGIGHEGGGGCEYETEVVDDLDATEPVGFAPREVIELADGTTTTSLRWQSPEQLQLSHSAGQSVLTIRIEHGGREVRILRPVSPRNAGNGEEGGPAMALPDAECPLGYEIDVELEFTTEGGAFAETFETTLVANSPDVVSFRQPIDHDELQGSFEVLGTLPPGGVVKQIAIGGILSPLGTYGNLDAVLEYRAPDDGSATDVVTSTVGGAGLIARWPAEGNCEGDYGSGLSIALDSELGAQTLIDAVTEANALFPRTLTWQVPTELPAAVPQADPEIEPGSDGSRPTPNLPQPMDVGEAMLSLSIVASEAACARLEGGEWRMRLPVTLEASTDDGSWQSQYAGELSALSGDAELSEVTLRAELNSVSVDAFEASTGITDVDLSGYDYGRVQLWLDVDAEQGSLEVQGADVADCVNNPPEPSRDENGNIVGSPGCRGTDLTVVRRGVF